MLTIDQFWIVLGEIVVGSPIVVYAYARWQMSRLSGQNPSHIGATLWAGGALLLTAGAFSLAVSAGVVVGCVLTGQLVAMRLLVPYFSGAEANTGQTLTLDVTEIKSHGDSQSERTAESEEQSVHTTDSEATTGTLDDFVRICLAGLTAALIAAGVGVTVSPPVTIAVAVGAPLAILLVWTADYPRFAAAGATYFLSTAVAFTTLSGSLPEPYYQDAVVGLVGFGLLSALIVTIQETVGFAIRRALRNITNGEYANAIWRFISSLLGALVIAWTIVTAHEKLARYGGSSVGGTAGLLFNIFGVEVPLPLWLADGVDATVVVFIGSVLLAFHSLDTLYGGWRLAKQTASAGTTVAQKGLETGAQSLDRNEE